MEPWWDGDVNAELFEPVLSYCRVCGHGAPAEAVGRRSLTSAVSSGRSTEQLCALAGVPA